MPISKVCTATLPHSVSCFISFRDITFEPTLAGVLITAVTDVPSHLWVRLSSKHPWIHKKTSLIRGLPLKEDLRFCFTVYEDNEQQEPGDTFTHTWVKPDWPECTTKWLYLWGSVAGETCVSTSPLFKYHNTGFTMDYPTYLQIDNYQWTKYLHRYVNGQTYNQCWTAPLATNIYSSSTRFVFQAKYSTNKYYIRRYPVIFDTSALPDDAVILAAVFSAYTVFPVGDNLDMVLVHVPDLAIPITTADYGRIHAARLSEIGRCLVADQTSTRQFFIKVNLDGLNSINKQGYTKWALICSNDQDGVAPVDTWEGNYIESDPVHLTIAYGMPT